MKFIFKCFATLIIMLITIIVMGLGFIFVSIVVLDFQNNAMLNKVAERMKRVESLLTADFELVSSDLRVSRDSGSGGYCSYDMDNIYTYPPEEIDEVVYRISQLRLPSTSVRADGAPLRLFSRRINDQIEISIEEGPVDNFFSLRC